MTLPRDHAMLTLLVVAITCTPLAHTWQHQPVLEGCDSVSGDERFPLTARGLDNIVAFTRALGYTRHFHPSDESAAQDWDALGARGVRMVEYCTDASSLSRSMEKLFKPVAPSVEIFLTGHRSPATPVQQAPPGVARLLTWQHRGFTMSAGNRVYRSERVQVSVPREPLEVDLGAGVSFRLPLSVWADREGTVPRGATAEPVSPTPGHSAFMATDRATRLAAVVLAWNVIQHFYPYFDVVNTDWPGALRTALRSAATDSGDRALATTLRRMVAALHDGHGSVYDRTVEFYAPAFTWEWVEGRLIVTDTGRNPSLALGDAVVSIDGIPASEAVTRAESLVSGATPQWVRYRALQELAWGEQGTSVVLDIQRYATGESRRVELVRDAPIGGYGRRQTEKLAEVAPGIVYVDLDRITDSDFEEAIPRLAQASGIVFDLRGYPRVNALKFFGHLSESSLKSQQWHVPLIRWPDHQRMEFVRMGEWDVAPSEPFFRARKVFIVDGRTISYAESCAGIVEHYKLGAIIGTPTAGTNGNASGFRVPGGLTVVFTAMKVLKHDGSQHHGVGILPTTQVGRTRAAIAAGRDEQLEAAITHLVRTETTGLPGSPAPSRVDGARSRK